MLQKAIFKIIAHLELSGLGMCAATSEETRRFNAEVSHLFDFAIQQTRLVLLFSCVLLSLDALLLGCRQTFLALTLRLEPIGHRSKVELVPLLNVDAIALVKVVNKESRVMERAQSSQGDALQELF